MHYVQQYRTELLNALESIDLRALDEAVEMSGRRAHTESVYFSAGMARMDLPARICCPTC